MSFRANRRVRLHLMVRGRQLQDSISSVPKWQSLTQNCTGMPGTCESYRVMNLLQFSP